MIPGVELDWKVRAEAAEKTVDILKRRVRALDAGTEKSIIQKQLESAQRRSLENDRKRELADMKNAELQRYSAVLEGEVQARTEQIRTILDNVTCGFLLIGADRRVQPGYTASCHALLGAAQIEGALLEDIFGVDAPGEQIELQMSLEQVFEDLLPEDLNLAQLRSRYVRGARVLRAEFRTVRGAGGEVDRLLLTITDNTALEEAERQARHHKALVQILSQRDAFRLFVADARRYLLNARDAQAEGDDAYVRRAVHTIKGNAASFGLEQLAATAHHVESGEVISEDDLDLLQFELQAFLASNFEVLQIPPEEGEDAVFQISEAQLREVSRLLAANDVAGVQHLMSALTLKPARQIVGPLESAVRRLSERLEKDVDFEVEGGDLSIDAEHLAPVLQCLPHLIRNAMDHGIEAPAEREGKRPRATLAVVFQEDGDVWRIGVRDDGRGIDGAQVADAAVRKGMIDAEAVAAMSDQDKVGLIFLNGLSTAREVSDISGRGVGVSAMQAAVALLGGAMAVETTVGMGTTFWVEVPKSSEAGARAAA